MAGASLLALLDDITTLLDDVATMTKIAARKTAGVLSDDLALNAQQVAGVSAKRELPVVWAVAKGSMLNKAFLIPVALLISEFLPWLIVLLLMIGGAYLCYEGVEKLLHSYQHWKQKKRGQHSEDASTLANTSVSAEDIAALEKRKIRGAIRTDFILSAEIIVIALNVVQNQTLMMKFLVLAAIAVLITVGVYGIVAAIVKLDDIGYWMVRDSEETALRRKLGMLLVNAAPHLMRFLSIVGTIAMFLVGGGIIMHNVAALHHMELDVANWIATTPAVGELFQAITPSIMSLVLGLIVGAVVLAVVSGIEHFFSKTNKADKPSAS